MCESSTETNDVSTLEIVSCGLIFIIRLSFVPLHHRHKKASRSDPVVCPSTTFNNIRVIELKQAKGSGRGLVVRVLDSVL